MKRLAILGASGNGSAFADALDKATDNQNILPGMRQSGFTLAKHEFNHCGLAEQWVGRIVGEK